MILSENLSNDISGLIAPFVSDVHTDILGNVIAHKPGNGKRIMLIAHHDVVRLMVSHIDENGFLCFRPAGSIDASILPARKVAIKHKDKTAIGIIGKKPVHLMRDEQSNKISYGNLWIDIGARSKDEALQMVSKGDYAYFSPEFDELPNNLISGSYLDNHAGLHVLLKLAEQQHNTEMPWDIYFVASDYEEIGFRGATVAAKAIKPDVCIGIDVTHAADYPTMNVITDGDIKLGEGCVLAKGPDICKELFDSLEGVASKLHIKYQVEVSPYPTGTDVNAIQLSEANIKTAVVSIPCRYMHTPHEICSKDDIDSAINIINGFMINY